MNKIGQHASVLRKDPLAGSVAVLPCRMLVNACISVLSKVTDGALGIAELVGIVRTLPARAKRLCSLVSGV